MIRSNIVNECKGCAHVIDNFCMRYPNPAYWWNNKVCPLATHRKEINKKTTDAQKKRVGQPKGKKKKK